MSLSAVAKDYIANHFGSGTPKCFVSGGIAYKDPNSVMQTGSTQDVVATLKMNIGGNARGPGNEVYIDIPDWTSISDPDVVAIGTMQSGALQYCVASSTGCVPATRRCKNGTTIEQCKADGSGWWDVQVCHSGYTCQNGVCVEATAMAETGPMEVYVGGGDSCDPGSPSVTLDTTEAFAFFKSDNHDYIGVGGIQVHNLDTGCRAYFAWEVRVWDGYGYTTCPTTVPEMKEINRYLVEAGGRPLSTTMLGASETDVVWGSFEVPSSMEGEKTICLSLWGNFDRDALIAELNTEGYYDKQ